MSAKGSRCASSHRSEGGAAITASTALLIFHLEWSQFWKETSFRVFSDRTRLSGTNVGESCWLLSLPATMLVGNFTCFLGFGGNAFIHITLLMLRIRNRDFQK